MRRRRPDPMVHLELHTGDLQGAVAFYGGLFGWRPERIEAGRGAGQGAHARRRGRGRGGGGAHAERPPARPLWLPYVKVGDVTEATRRARELGASVELAPREGEAGWRSVPTAP